MINTFNLEQNLLTFPLERDILTRESWGVSATEDEWLDGRILTCPRAIVHAAVLATEALGHTWGARLEKWGLATQEAQQADASSHRESRHQRSTGRILPGR